MSAFDSLVWGAIACDALLVLLALFAIWVAYRSVSR